MRTKGATSNVGVKMRDLKKILGDDAIVPVARLWALNLGFRIDTSAPPVVYELDIQKKWYVK